MKNYPIIVCLYIFSIILLGLGGSLGSMVSNKTASTIEENKNVKTIGVASTIVGGIFAFAFICFGISFFIPYTSEAANKLAKSFSYMIIILIISTIFILSIGIRILVIANKPGNEFLNKNNIPFTNENDIEEARNDYYVEASQWIIAFGVFTLTSSIFYTISNAGKINPNTFKAE